MVRVIRRQSARSCRPANTMSSTAQPKLSYDADKFSVELSVAEYSPEVPSYVDSAFHNNAFPIGHRIICIYTVSSNIEGLE